MTPSLIVTAKLNDVDPQAWLADTLVRIAETPQSLLSELLPWNWMPIVSPAPPPDRGLGETCDMSLGGCRVITN